jgi:undecaprenyl-phosphate 4-deoxy-4-formamido-L-arabinose transferase
MKGSMTLKPNCSIVIPVYNGEETLAPLVSRISQVMPSISRRYELILINDGSRDRSWEEICDLRKQFKWITGINLARNYGQHNALLCGIRHAKYDILITLDDDLQNPPEEIPLLLEKLAEGYDVVYGSPLQVKQNLWRALASQVIRLVLRNVMGSKFAWHASPFRAFRTSLRNAFAHYANQSVFIDVLLAWATTRFTAVTVRQDERRVGTSTYTFGKLLNLAISMLTGYSTLPLRAASMVGFSFTFFGMCVLVYVLGRFIIAGGSIPGFPFLASIIAIFSGATLFALGIMGEYLARMYNQSMGQPPYVIKDE